MARDGVLAADTARWRHKTYWGPADKLFRGNRGLIIGAATGNCSMLGEVQLWFGAGQPEDKPDIEFDDLSLLAIDGEKKIWFSGGDLRFVRHFGEFAAIGSGGDFALGAMALGANAIQAVGVACKFDQQSQEPVTMMKVDDDG